MKERKMMNYENTIKELQKHIESLKTLIDDDKWESVFEDTNGRGRLVKYEEILKEIIKVSFDDIVGIKKNKLIDFMEQE